MELKQNQRIIEQIITLPQKSKEETAEDLNLFKDNFDLILKHSDLIIHTPEYYHTHLVGYPVGLIFLGGYNPPLGALLELWAQNEFVDTCDVCGERLYFFQGGGSPLSGRNKCLGICRTCQSICCKKYSGAGQLGKAYQYIKAQLNTRKVLKTKGQYFTFKYGLIGSPIPDVIIEHGVQTVELSELICILNQIEK